MSCKDKCEKYEKIKYLKTKEACIKNAIIKTAEVDNMKIEDDISAKNLVIENSISANIIVSEKSFFKTITTDDFTADNAKINNLEIKNLNGKNLACQQSFQNVNSPIDTSDPLEYPENSTFDKKVWDGLAAETLRQKNDLATRLQCGRLQLRYIQREFGCEPCPPDELENCFPECDPPAPEGEVCDCPNEVGNCPAVPLKIFGIKTDSPVNQIICGPTQQETSTQLISSISYNLDVTNISGTLATRVVTILVHAGYLNENGDFVYQELDLGNRQFGATLDTVYGEKYTGSVVLDTKFMEQISTYPNTGALIQLIIFQEDGVAIDIKGQGKLSSKGGISSKADPIISNGPVDTSYLGKSVGNQLQWANIYSNYNNKGENLTSMLSSFTLSKSAPATQWVMGWSFEGGPAPAGGGAGGYFGINTGDDGAFQVLASIFNVAESPEAKQDYVTPVRFGGEGVGWSLRIKREDISNFPIELNTTYLITIQRKEEIVDGKCTWDFYIVNIDTANEVFLGNIKTPETWKFISGQGLYQFSEYYGPGQPNVTCPTVPLSVIDWSFPSLNGEDSTYFKWTAPPQHCGEYRIEANPDNKNVKMSYGCTGCN